MTSKYIKFGLRADKNLADLTVPTTALANLLDDISLKVNDQNVSTGFFVQDIEPIKGLRNTGLSDFTDENGRSNDLVNLNGTIVTFTNTSNSVLPVEPLVTLQDNISNFKSILGKPPWINGGDGLVCKFVGSDRIKSTALTPSITGNSANVSAISGLSASQLWTSSTTGNLTRLIGPVDFWNNGVFAFSAKLHPEMKDTYGLVQWTGYLSTRFNQNWGSTGLFIIEEDTVDDGTENNWTQLKSVFSASQTIDNLSFSSPSGGIVTMNFGSATSGGVPIRNYICTGMKFGSSSEYTVVGVNQAGKTATVESSSAISGTTHTFTFALGQDEVSTPVNFTSQKAGNRVRVRYTLWYPKINNGSAYRQKTFREVTSNSNRAPFSDFYKEFDRNQVFGPYTYKYFSDNKASELNQTSNSKLTVLDTISLLVDPPKALTDKVLYSTATGATPKTITVRDGFGKISASNFTGVSVGDWMAFERGGRMFAYQILDISGSDIAGNPYAYVKENFNQDTDNSNQKFSIGDTESVLFFKNLGLIGLFRLSSAGNSTGSLYQLYPQTSDTVNPNTTVFTDQIIMSINPNGTQGMPSKRVFSATGTSPRTVVINDYLSSGTSAFFASTSTNHFAAVYASRGLDDKASYLQCNGVYGREVNATAGSGQSQIELTTTEGVTIGDYVHFYGSGSAGGTGAVPGSPDFTNNKVGTTTTVQSINNSTKTITLTAPLTAAIPKARTIVFIKSTIGGNSNDPQSANKEFCVIPLNTAPPFEGTTIGLKTPSANANLVVVGLTFGTLKIQTPTSKLVAISGSPEENSSAYFPIKYGNSAIYKALIV